jgi:hypothetical protein
MSSTELSQTSFASANRRTAKHVKMSSKLATYGAAATGAAAVLGGASVAEAGIIYSGVRNQTVAQNSSFTLDFGATSNSDSLATGSSANQFIFDHSEYLNYLNFNNKYVKLESLINDKRVRSVSGDAANGVEILASGTIDATNMTLGAGGNSSINIQSFYNGNNFGGTNANGYIGVKFNSSGYYGWIQYQGTFNAATETYSVKIVDWAYDDTGASIQAGAVPEPTGLGLLALGALTGASRWRRRREEQSAA